MEVNIEHYIKAEILSFSNIKKQIDVFGKPHKIDVKYELPHTHLGYLHDENGTYKPSARDKNLIDVDS